MTNIGRAIKVLRVMRGTTGSALAKKCKVSNALLSLVERGERSPSIELLTRLAVALNVELDVLLLFVRRDKSSLKTRDKEVRAVATKVDSLLRAEEDLRNVLETLEGN